MFPWYCVVRPYSCGSGEFDDWEAQVGRHVEGDQTNLREMLNSAGQLQDQPLSTKRGQLVSK